MVVVAAAVATTALGGCRATTYDAESVGYVELTAAGPVDAELYPHTYYDGRVVYYVNDHWWYLDRGRWAYYRDEPPALHVRRTHVPSAGAAPAVRVP